MGMVHRMVVESCSDYFVQMRRRVYQTPRSFLSFLGSYQVRLTSPDAYACYDTVGGSTLTKT